MQLKYSFGLLNIMGVFGGKIVIERLGKVWKKGGFEERVVLEKIYERKYSLLSKMRTIISIMQSLQITYYSDNGNGMYLYEVGGNL